ncbi:MAG TPA: c-type cytochrome [Steroidobacteraceae bacterium]|nr:c-type cytochrome [Steroidobacteraceae bacterium]
MALRISAVVLLLLAPLASMAQAPAGDAKRGQVLAYTCNGCHAIPNYKNVYPTYSVPKLHGQRPEYLLAALKAYKSGERSHGTMHSQASSMNEQDMADVAAYLSGPEVLTVSKHDVPATARPKASEVCLACHGTNGVGITADYPTLSGQHRDYIERALHDYKMGGRKNVIMVGMAATLTREDIEQLAAYYASQEPALQVVPKKKFFFSSN